MSKIKFIGAAQTVTGSRTLIEHNGFKLLVDCGLFQGPKEIREKNWEEFPDANKIDVIILTHAHIDHSGYLPKMIKEGFRGKILTTRPTHALCKIMLPDSGRLQEEDADYANRSQYSTHRPALPLYTEADAFLALKQFYDVDPNQWQVINKDISVRFLRAGHILGASIVQLSLATADGVKLITFSGDLGNGRSSIMHDPVAIKETDTLILESTYGDRLQPRVDVLEALEQIISRVIGRGGSLIIPSFAVGRTQEILYLIRQLEEAKRIDSVPVFLDSPMAKEATEIYQKFSTELKVSSSFEPKNLFYTKSADESMLLCMDETPKIVISAAGMLSGGRVLHHLKTKLPKTKNGVLFVGYQVQGTKGYLLKNGLKKICIHHQEIDVEAEIFSIDSLSAHADCEDLISWSQQFTKVPSQTFLNHGERFSLETLKYRLTNELNWPDVIIPAAGDEFNL